MNFSSKYNVGDRCFRPELSAIDREICTCPVCGGSGASARFPERRCNASFDGYICREGKMISRTAVWVPKQVSITGVRAFKFDKKKVEFDYIYVSTDPTNRRLDDDLDYVEHEENMFATLEECQKFCDSKNAKC